MPALPAPCPPGCDDIFVGECANNLACRSAVGSTLSLDNDAKEVADVLFDECVGAGEQRLLLINCAIKADCGVAYDEAFADDIAAEEFN